MRPKRIDWSEKHLNARLNDAFYTGEKSGMESVVGYIRQQSGAAYAAGNDERAKTLRDLALDIEHTMVKKAQEHAKTLSDELKRVEQEDP